MKTFIEFEDDKATIEAMLQAKNLLQEWQTSRAMVMADTMYKERAWNYFNYDENGKCYFFIGLYDQRIDWEEWYFIRLTNNELSFEAVMRFFRRIFSSESIIDLLCSIESQKMTLPSNN